MSCFDPASGFLKVLEGYIIHLISLSSEGFLYSGSATIKLGRLSLLDRPKEESESENSSTKL
jgi:hypothetical protein